MKPSLSGIKAMMRHLLSAHYCRQLKNRGVRILGPIEILGRPVVTLEPGSKISFGSGLKLHSRFQSNPIGIANACVIRTLAANAEVQIGANSGLSGTVICAARSVRVGEETLIGSGCLVIDNDFHSFVDGTWVNNFVGTSQPVEIGSRVFIGARCIILKGVVIGDGAVVGAGAVVAKSIPPGMIAAGNPAKIVGTIRK